MKLNTVYNMDFLSNNLPDKSVNLIIADPPYFEVKGKFDFIWGSFDAYLQDVEKWSKECKRLLADNGTLFWWGMAGKIAYSQIILDKYFSLCNSMMWEKIDSMQCQYYSAETARRFNTHNERLLMYEAYGESGNTGLERVMEEHIKPRHPFAKYLREEFKRAGVNRKQIAALFPSKTGKLTGCVSNWLNGDNVITEEQYNTIREYLNGEYLRKEYEDLRKEYEEQRRPFFNTAKLTDVLRFSQDTVRTRKYDHPTKKPEHLTRALILTCSRKNDLVLAPFAGSGTECAVAKKEGRRFIGFEIDPKHAKTAQDRCDKTMYFPQLFN